MKKRIVALLLAIVTATMLVLPGFAEEAPAVDAAPAPSEGEALTPVGPGGLDFYSITINYENPILVDYQKSGSKYLFNLGDDYTMDDKFVYRAGVTKTIDYFTYEKKTKGNSTNFYQLVSSEENIPAEGYYSSFPYNYAYITHIQDGMVLKTKDILSLYGITDPYDDGDPYVNHNPNCNYGDDGYALDKNKDEDGNYYRIDINNYRINKDYVWIDSEGRRVELFYQKACYVLTGKNEKNDKPIYELRFMDEYEPLPFDVRFDENGKIIDTIKLNYTLYINKDELNTWADENKDTATAQNPAILYLKFADTEELNTEVTKTNKKLYNTKTTGARLFRVSIPETDLEVVEEKDEKGKVISTTTVIKPEYYSVDRKFTFADIVRDEKGNLVTGTPVVGDPQLNVKIKNITIEIDALGTDLYSDPAQDPQNQNTIVISINDYEKNCLAKKAALDEKYILQNTYDDFSSKIIATVNSKTTTKDVNWDKDSIVNESYKPSVQSIDLGLTAEEIEALPMTATFFFNFHIKTHQPEAAFDFDHLKTVSKKDTSSTLLSENAAKWVSPKEKAEYQYTVTETYIPWNIIIPCAIGGVVLIAAIIVIIVVSKKKKKA